MPTELPPGPNPAQIEERDLRDDQRLSDLYREFVRRGWWTNTARRVHDFWCLAEKALDNDKMGTPGRLFVHLSRGQADLSHVTQAQEDRALARIGSEEREALVQSALVVAPLSSVLSEESQHALFGTTESSAPAIGYHHSVMMQTFLPQRRRPIEIREHHISHGRASLIVEAGQVAHPAEGRFVRCPLPYGSRARLIVPWINQYALTHRTREIDLGATLWRFLRRIGSPVNAHNAARVTEQIQAIAAARFVLGAWSEAGSVTRYGRIAEAVSFWADREMSNDLLWSPTMLLSSDYYAALCERPVPISMTHLVQLTRSPRRMDLFAWFSYRLPNMRADESLRIPLVILQPIFAPEMGAMKMFKYRLFEDLRAIYAVYPRFRIALDGSHVELRRSPSPVAARMKQLT